MARRIYIHTYLTQKTQKNEKKMKLDTMNKSLPWPRKTTNKHAKTLLLRIRHVLCSLRIRHACLVGYLYFLGRGIPSFGSFIYLVKMCNLYLGTAFFLLQSL